MCLQGQNVFFSDVWMSLCAGGLTESKTGIGKEDPWPLFARFYKTLPLVQEKFHYLKQYCEMACKLAHHFYFIDKFASNMDIFMDSSIFFTKTKCNKSLYFLQFLMISAYCSCRYPISSATLCYNSASFEAKF